MLVLSSHLLHRIRIVASLLLALAGTARADSPRGNNHVVPDFLGQFANLDPRAELLGFHIKGYPKANGSTPTTHFQGIVRRTGTGIPIFFVSRAGTSDDDEGNVMVVRMGSRLSDGERLRSNRLAKGEASWDTEPPDSDRVIHQWKPGWHHIGGLALVGDILAVPLEKPLAENKNLEGAVWFYDVSEPTRPLRLPHLDLGYETHEAGVVGLVRLPDRHYLLLVTWGDGDTVNFYRSTKPSLTDTTAGWERIDAWKGSELKSEKDDTWPTGKTSFQGLSLHVSGGHLYLVGTRNDRDTVPVIPGEDEAIPFEITGWADGSSKVTVTQIGPARKFDCHAAFGDIGFQAQTYNANFLAGASTYVSPSGELILYAIEHYNWGPGGSVRLVEFRHELVARPDGPRYGPKARLILPEFLPLGTHEIGLTNVALHQLRPWIQLFDGDDFSGQRIIIDRADEPREDYQDFRKLDGSGDGFNDRASSLRWWAPNGWKVELFDSDNFRTDDSVLRLTSSGRIQSISNLSDSPWKFDNGPQFGPDETRITSARLVPPDDGETPDPLKSMVIQWSVLADPPDAAEIKTGIAGKATLTLQRLGTVLVIARMTGLDGGESTVAKRLRIVNTPPEITRFEVNTINGGIVQAQVSVRDIGNDGTVALRIDWGDGRVTTGNPQAGGTFGAQHQYADLNPNRPLWEDYTIRVTITDPEGLTDEDRFSGEDAPPEATDRTVRIEWRPPAPDGDADADGLPDAWEQKWFGGLAYDGHQDTDGDGVWNRQEFLNGSNPMDSDDRLELRITRRTRDVTLQFETRKLDVEIPGKSKRVHLLEWSTTAAGGVWNLLGEAAGDDTPATFQSPSGTGSRFFRLRSEFR